MNQDINNENIIQNQVDNTMYQPTNVMPETQEVSAQEVAPIQPEQVEQNPVVAEQNTADPNQAATPEQPVKTSKKIVLDEDPVKFDVPVIESSVDTYTDTSAATEPQEEEPQVQTGAIQF